MRLGRPGRAAPAFLLAVLLLASGCLAPRWQADCSQPGVGTLQPERAVAAPRVALFQLAPEEAARQVAAAHGDVLRDSEGPQEGGPGAWSQEWRTNADRLRVTWSTAIDAIEYRGPFGPSDGPDEILEAWPGLLEGVRLSWVRDLHPATGFKVSMDSPIGPVEVGYGQNVGPDGKHFTSNAYVRFEAVHALDAAAQYVPESEAVKAALDHVSCHPGARDRPPLAKPASVRAFVGNEGLSYLVEPSWGRCATEFVTVDARSGAVVHWQPGSWCG